MNIKSVAIKSAVGLIGVGGASGLVAHQLLSKQGEKEKDSIEDKQKEGQSSKNIKNQLTSKNVTLIDTGAIDKIWKTAWNEINSDPSIKTTESTVNSHETLKSWCTNNYQKSSDEQTILEKVEKLCIQPPKNVGEKLARKKVEFTNDWGSKLATLKSGDSDNTLLNKLKETTTDLADLNTPNTANAALQKWCENKKNMELPESGGVGYYDEVVKYCAK